MKLTSILAALVMGVSLAACGGDDDGGTTGVPDEAKNFVSKCNSTMTKMVGALAAKLPASAKEKIMSAQKGICPCVANEVASSDKISADDKKKIWAVKEFKPKAIPGLSADAKAEMEKAGQKCSEKFKAAVTDAMKK